VLKCNRLRRKTAILNLGAKVEKVKPGTHYTLQILVAICFRDLRKQATYYLINR